MKHLVFISGASSGIGLAMARSVPWSQTRVVDISRRGTPDFEHFRADLSDPADWPRVGALFAREIAAFGGDRVVFVHSAGTLDPIGFAGEVDAEAYARQVLLNSASPQVLGDAFLRATREIGARRQMLIVGSGASRNVYEGWSAYCGGKAAADQWARTVGTEQRRRGGCQILCIAPGIIETAMQEQIRATDTGDFPEVQRFRELRRDGLLRTAERAARDLWGILDKDYPSGSVLDLRDA